MKFYERFLKHTDYCRGQRVLWGDAKTHSPIGFCRLVPVMSPPPQQVYIRGNSAGVHLHLPPESFSWTELWSQITLRLQASPQLVLGQSQLMLWAGDWELNTQNLQAIAALAATKNLGLYRVQTHRRQTAIAAVELGYSVEQTPPLAPYPLNGTYANTLYVSTTIRSGTSIQHDGSVVVVGDINPGGEVQAGGNILVWGRLKGVAHAGALGNKQATIMALYLMPTQLRLTNRVARAAEGNVQFPTPEVAFLEGDAIRISSVSEYLRRAL